MKLQSGSRLKCMMWAAGNTGNDFGGGSITILYNPLKQDQHDYISLTGVFDEFKPPPPPVPDHIGHCQHWAKKQQKMLRLWDAVIFQAELPVSQQMWKSVGLRPS